MRQIDDAKLKEIQAKAEELMSLVNGANCRLVAYMDEYSWDFDLKLVPNEVEMGERGIYKENEDSEAEPVDLCDIPATGVYGTILNTEINSLYEEGECADPYNF